LHGALTYCRRICCPVLRLDGARPLAELVADVRRALGPPI
jgi:hypothetical protein